MTDRGVAQWLDAVRAACLLAIDPLALRGIVVRGGQTPAAQEWLALVQSLVSPDQRPMRLPVSAEQDAVRGSLDMIRSLQTGKVCRSAGIIERLGTGMLIVPLANQVAQDVGLILGRALQHRTLTVGEVSAPRMVPAHFTVVALDESEPGEPTTRNGITNQISMSVDFTGVSLRDIDSAGATPEIIAQAKQRISRVNVSDQNIRDICEVSDMLGVPGMTAVVLAMQVARASAALTGYTELSQSDLELATRLTLAHRATQIPSQDAPNLPDPQSTTTPAEQDAQEPEPIRADQNASPTAAPEKSSDAEFSRPDTPDSCAELMIESARALVPPDLLNDLLGPSNRLGPSQTSGRFGTPSISLRRGRPIGVKPGNIRDGIRLSLSHTLRAAIPFQPMRKRQLATQGRAHSRRFELRPNDCRVRRFRQSTATQSIFVVDASGSAALQRLAEAKGAVELLLADCYVRRDTVSMVAFRGKGARLLLPATRSLTRAKRELARLHGGGGTPTAAGLQMAIGLANQARQAGQSPVLIILTDGRANVTLDGAASRDTATEQALHVARQIAASPTQSIVIDTALRATDQTKALAGALGAECVRLPYADPESIKHLVREHQPVAA